MFNWFTKKLKKEECYMCGEVAELTQFNLYMYSYGKICKKCADAILLSELPRLKKEKEKLNKERLNKQLKWREKRDQIFKKWRN